MELGQRNFGTFLPILSECLLQASRDQVKKYGGELKKLLPDHNRLEKIEANPKQEPKTERGLLIQNVTNFLLDYANQQEEKIAIYLNDMQWADEASIETLEELMYKIQNRTVTARRERSERRGSLVNNEIASAKPRNELCYKSRVFCPISVIPVDKFRLVFDDRKELFY